MSGGDLSPVSVVARYATTETGGKTYQVRQGPVGGNAPGSTGRFSVSRHMA